MSIHFLLLHKIKRSNTKTLTELFNRITVLSTEVLKTQSSTQGYIVFTAFAAVTLISFVLFLICKRLDTDDWLTVLLAIVCSGCGLLTPRFVSSEPSQLQITVSVPQDVTVDDLTEYFTVVAVGNLNDECIVTLETNQDLDTYEEVMTYLQGII